MREIYIVYFWPDFEDSPQNLIAVKFEVEAQELIFSFWGTLLTTIIFLLQFGIQLLIQEIFGMMNLMLLILATIK